MWPSKKKKGIDLPPGKCTELEFTASWASDKREVVIMTDKGPITLNEKSEFYIEISSDNTNTIKVQIIPDFKNKTLKFVEIIDPSMVSTDDKNKGKLVFAGVNTVKMVPVPVGEYLKNWDESIENIGNKLRNYEKRKNILTIVLSIVTLLNIYLAIINRGILRYINIIAVMVAIYTLYNLWESNKKIYEDYEELKRLRDETFGVVKEK